MEQSFWSNNEQRVSHHSLLFSKTAVLCTLSEHDALQSKPQSCHDGQTVQQGILVGPMSVPTLSGQRTKFPRAYAASNAHSENLEKIKAKINLLLQILSNKDILRALYSLICRNKI